MRFLVELRRDLANYRMERSIIEVDEAKQALQRGSYYRALSSSYYAMFHAVRALLSYDEFDAKKHSAVISFFNKNYVASGKLDKKFARTLTNAFDVRRDSDYKDFFKATREEAERQVADAVEFVQAIQFFLSLREKS